MLCLPISPRSPSLAYVRGTPASGKTTLAKLLGRFYAERGDKVVIINGWIPNNLDHTQRLTTACHQSGYTSVTVHTLLDERIVFIFDEAQQSYSDQGLWLGFIKSVSGMRGGARMCLWSLFCDNKCGPKCNDDGRTHPFLLWSFRVLSR
jgi:predicted AAA+ superfamily ATPase